MKPKLVGSPQQCTLSFADFDAAMSYAWRLGDGVGDGMRALIEYGLQYIRLHDVEFENVRPYGGTKLYNFLLPQAELDAVLALVQETALPKAAVLRCLVKFGQAFVDRHMARPTPDGKGLMPALEPLEGLGVAVAPADLTKG